MSKCINQLEPSMVCIRPPQPSITTDGVRMNSIKSTVLALAMITAACATIAAQAEGLNYVVQSQQGKAEDGTAKNDKEDERQILYAVEGAKTIKSMMINPSSFKLESMSMMSAVVVCYVYSSKNGSGWTDTGAAILVENKIKTNAMQGFDQQWQKECQGKKGKDLRGYGELMVY